MVRARADRHSVEEGRAYERTYAMTRLSCELRKLIVHRILAGASINSIVVALDQQGATVCRQTVWRLKKHYHTHGFTAPLLRSGRPTKLSNQVLELIESAMQNDDETTAKQLHAVLEGAGVSVSHRTILKGRKSLGLTYRGAAYCQMIRDVNKVKRLNWALANKDDDFADVVWTDESSVQLETHRRFCCRKNGQKPRYKPRPKHPIKVHVWARISWNGRTEICIFDGIMDAEMYTKILEKCLVPFCQRIYPQRYRFMQDNDPKHTSKRAQKFFEDHGITWWRTPPESPDANPIENMWNELKVSVTNDIVL